ncbi:MAG: S8 family serine peptidase, partial [bacterium]|nr:S8 family serine peptidase [bacterium]
MKSLLRFVIVLFVVKLSFGAVATPMVIEQRDKISPLTAIVMKAASSGSDKLSSLTTTDVITGETLAPLFVYGSVSITDIEALGGKVGTVFHDWKTVQIPVSRISALSSHPSVRFIESAPPVYPLDAISNADTSTGGGLWIGNGAATAHGLYDGTDVIVGVIDAGTDWSHLDFRRDDNTAISRIQYLWDMPGSITGGRVHPSGFSYGVEYTNAHINNEIDGTPAGFVTSMKSSSFAHGTATASIAASDGSGHVSGLAKGVAPGSDLLIVRTRGTSVLSFATDLVDAVNWMFQKANALGKPIVINISLGSHWGAHDGSRADEEYFSAQSGAGKIIVTACGNSGNSNVRAMGTVAPSSSQTATFSVAASCANALFDIWHHGSDAFTLRITSPSAQVFDYVSGTDAEAVFTGNDTVDVYNATNSLGTPTNSAKHIVVDMYGSLGNFLAAGTWTFEYIRTANGGDGAWDAWMVNSGTAVGFTSQTSTSRTLTMPGTASGAISVGAYYSGGQYTDMNSNSRGSATNNGLFWSGSSRGPTRTGGEKPDIIAATSVQRVALPSTMVVNDTLKLPGGLHYVVTLGTSYAAPQVTGAVALLLQKWPTLTPAQVKTKLFDAAKTDAQTGAEWNANAGNGRLHLANAPQAAAQT